jgi:hypothetical protein
VLRRCISSSFSKNLGTEYLGTLTQSIVWRDGHYNPAHQTSFKRGCIFREKFVGITDV